MNRPSSQPFPSRPALDGVARIDLRRRLVLPVVGCSRKAIEVCKKKDREGGNRGELDQKAAFGQPR